MCTGDLTLMNFKATTWNGKPAYDPQFEVNRSCRKWDRINNWALERALMDDANIDLIII